MGILSTMMSYVSEGSKAILNVIRLVLHLVWLYFNIYIGSTRYKTSDSKTGNDKTSEKRGKVTTKTSHYIALLGDSTAVGLGDSTPPFAARLTRAIAGLPSARANWTVLSFGSLWSSPEAVLNKLRSSVVNEPGWKDSVVVLVSVGLDAAIYNKNPTVKALLEPLKKIWTIALQDGTKQVFVALPPAPKCLPEEKVELLTALGAEILEAIAAENNERLHPGPDFNVKRHIPTIGAPYVNWLNGGAAWSPTSWKKVAASWVETLSKTLTSIEWQHWKGALSGAQ